MIDNATTVSGPDSLGGNGVAQLESKAMKYLGYTIKKTELGFTLRTPSGDGLTGVAVNLKTASRWVEQHLAEARNRRVDREQVGACGMEDACGIN